MTLWNADWLRRIRDVLFERDVSRKIFEHTRNLVVATLVLAAGLEAIEHEGMTYQVKLDHAPGTTLIGGVIDRADYKGDVLRINTDTGEYVERAEKA